MSEDLWSNEGAVCPYCKHVNLAQDENWSLWDENVSEFECNDCGKEFKVEAFASWSWTSEPVDDEEAA